MCKTTGNKIDPIPTALEKNALQATLRYGVEGSKNWKGMVVASIIHEATDVCCVALCLRDQQCLKTGLRERGGKMKEGRRQLQRTDGRGQFHLTKV